MADIKCRILAIDGGGIRGVIPAYILQQLEATLGGQQIFEVFDVIAGTSTGGIIALGLTTPSSSSSSSSGDTVLPYTAKDILNFYMDDESELFVPTPAFSGGAKYYGTAPSGTSGIQPWLQNAFGSTTTLSQAQQNLAKTGKSMPKQVLVTGFTINANNAGNVGPYLFNWNDASNSALDDYYVWEAARGTGAAPSYFPAAQIGSGAPGGSSAAARWVVDGGLVANNPAMYALAEAAKLGLYQSLDEVFILSLGTGLFNPAITNTNNYDWSAMTWLSGTDTAGDTINPLLQVMGTGNILAPDAQLQSLMPWGNYWRIDPPISYSETQMAGTDQSALQTTTQNYISSDGGAGFYAFAYTVNVLGGTLPSSVDLGKLTPPARKADARRALSHS